MHDKHLVIGAGVAGLTCARELSLAGHEVLVVDKSRGAGGRCATRRVDDQPVDYGPVFVHGSDADFVELVRSLPGVQVLDDWPRRRRGAGKPCQHDTFLPTEHRFALAEGVSALPKFLAEHVHVRLDTRVTDVSLHDARWRVEVAGAEPLETSSLVLAMPVEQTLAFVWPLVEHSEELEAVAMLLDMIPSLPCLTVLAGYPLDTPAPDWDIFYPESSESVMLVCHDSAKRPTPRHRALVIQASPRWSRDNLDADPDSWSRALLEETANLIGPWVAKPAWKHAHRWRYSRVDLGNELTGPVRITLPGGASLGLAGDVFAPGGGLEASWLAGRTLARRMLREESDHE